jgi:hypothetical protein
MPKKKGILDTVMGMGEGLMGNEESQESSTSGRGLAGASKSVREKIARKGGKASHSGGRKSQ